MSMQERRQSRREANLADLGRVAAAPAAKSSRKRRETRKTQETPVKPAGRSPLRRGMIAAIFGSIVVAGLISTPKLAKAGSPPPVPEIDAGSMAGALTLLVGGVLALTDRVRRV